MSRATRIALVINLSRSMLAKHSFAYDDKIISRNRDLFVERPIEGSRAISSLVAGATIRDARRGISTDSYFISCISHPISLDSRFSPSPSPSPSPSSRDAFFIVHVLRYVARITLRIARYRSFGDHSATLTAQSYSPNFSARLLLSLYRSLFV